MSSVITDRSVTVPCSKFRLTETVLFDEISGLKYPSKVNGIIHAEKSFHLKILEWTSMLHGYSIHRHMDIREHFQCIDNSAWIFHGHFNPGLFRRFCQNFHFTQCNSSVFFFRFLPVSLELSFCVPDIWNDILLRPLQNDMRKGRRIKAAICEFPAAGNTTANTQPMPSCFLYICKFTIERSLTSWSHCKI